MSLNRMPLVSVVICAYDNPTSLAEALESVVNQTYQNIEVIVSDDAGPTNLLPIVESFRKRFGPRRLKFHRHSENLGVARNKAWSFALAQGRYCAFLEHDDRWTDAAFLSQAVELLEDSDRVLIVAGNAILEGTETYPARLQYRNTVRDLRLGTAWKVIDGQRLARAMLRPVSLLRIGLGTLGEPANFSWSSLVFRVEAVRSAGELTLDVLLSDDEATALDVYPNEESFMFLYRLLAKGSAAVTGRPVSWRGRPPSSFSNLQSSKRRRGANDVELFNLIGVAGRIGKENAEISKALRRRASSVGLARTSPEILSHLKHRGFGWSGIIRARWNHGLHVRAGAIRRSLSPLWGFLAPLSKRDHAAISTE